MLRTRKFVMLVAVLALVGAACGKTKNVESPTGSASPTPLSETSFSQCTITQGTQAPAAATGTTFTTKKAGELLVGSDTTYPPFESIENGKAVGFDVDLITEIAKRLNLTVKVQTAIFDTIFTALASHKYDVVISSVTIKQKRKDTIDFTDPYMKSDQSIAIDTAKQPDVKGVDDLATKTVGVQKGTTGEDCANALKALGKVKQVRSYSDIPTAFSDMTAGRIDAVLNDLPTSKRIVEQRGGSLRLVQIIRTKEEYGIAVPKNNPNLREAINKALAAIKADGTYKTLFVKWFKTEPPAE